MPQNCGVPVSEDGRILKSPVGPARRHHRGLHTLPAPLAPTNAVNMCGRKAPLTSCIKHETGCTIGETKLTSCALSLLERTPACSRIVDKLGYTCTIFAAAEPARE